MKLINKNMTIKGTFLTLFFLIIGTIGIFAQSPTRTEFTNVVDRTVSLGAGASDTTVSSVIVVEGDSLCFVMEAYADSTSGSIRIQYVSPTGFTDTTTFAYYTTAATLPNNGKAVFGDKVTHLASAQWAKVWMITKNNDSSTQSIRTRAWRVRRK